MTIGQYISTFLKGMAMGIVNVIPVSSGTLSLIIGVFERFINSIKSLNIKAFKLLFKGEFSEFAKQTDFKFLVTLLMGIVAGMILTAISLKAIFEEYQKSAYAFFIGLIIVSAIYVLKMIGKKTPKMIILMLVAIVASFYLSIKSNPNQNPDFFYMILCGVVGSLGMIVPGVSGSHLMMVMGNYELIVTESIPKMTNLSTFGEGAMILLPFVIGAIVSIITASYFLSWLMKVYRNETLSVLSGFMIGSLPAVYPWKVSNAEGTSYIFELPSINNVDDQLVMSIVMALLGAFLIWIFNYYSAKKEAKLKQES